MASDRDPTHPLYTNDDDEDEDDDSSSSSQSDDAAPPPPLPPPPPPPPSTAIVAMAAPTAISATPVSERKPPIDDSRRLFQRLWTDEDEIELLQGFLDYTAHRGPTWSGHHPDTAAFYDLIKSKLQLDCNKNQLVEKLRRLKKKYRTVVARVASGKDFAFKSPHDQATFDISRKIWSNSVANNRPEFDEDDHNSLNPNPGTPVRKRPRVVVKVEEKRSLNVNSNSPGCYEPVILAPVAPSPAVVEEAVRSCLTPLLKDLVDNSAAASRGTGIGIGISSLASPMNFPGEDSERWRKQKILELEVYSKRLELVQDQIKAKVEELRGGRN